jgi:hypothetical protein
MFLINEHSRLTFAVTGYQNQNDMQNHKELFRYACVLYQLTLVPGGI